MVIVPKPLSKEEKDQVDAVHLLAGWTTCKACSGRGYQEGTWQRELTPGHVIHVPRGICYRCKGARLLPPRGLNDLDDLEYLALASRAWKFYKYYGSGTKES
jgi:hypothetical protein